MKVNPNSIWILFRSGNIKLEGVKDAVKRKFITAEEYKMITGQEYTED